MIFSASAVTAQQQYGHSYIFLVRQAAWLFIGLLGMFALMRTDYRRLREPAVIYPVVCIVLLLLIGTFFLDKSHATHRWIKFGPVGIQPSDLAKLATILYLDRKSTRLNSSHSQISYAVFCLKKKKKNDPKQFLFSRYLEINNSHVRYE